MFSLRHHLSALLSLALVGGQPAFSETIAAMQPSTKSPGDTTSSSKEALPTIPFEKYTLKNGLDVILSVDHTLPLVATNVWYHVGPANELPGRTGFAHLFEHMMFQGSKHVGAKAHFKHLEGAGASSINGTTSLDRTNYFETVPSNQLELALWLESDRMGFLLDTLDREKLANQRDVVRNERRQSIENRPYGLVEEAIAHELYPIGHPYRADVIGSHADIEAARINDVREFFKQYYTPNNASLVIAGDFDKQNVKALVEKYFGSIPAGPSVPKIQINTPSITERRKVTVTDRVELPKVYMSWLTAPIFKPGEAEGDLVAHILGGGKSSRLYKKLVYDRQIAQDVHVSNSGQVLGSAFTIEATAKPGVKLEDLEQAINEELTSLRSDGVKQSEIEGARNTIEASMIGGLESLGRVADRLNEYNYLVGDPGYLPRDLERYNKATQADLKSFANRYLTDNSCIVLYGVPGKKVIEDVPQTKVGTEVEAIAVTTGTADDAWRAEPPKPQAASKLNLPVPTSFKLANGLTVYLVERHNLPLVTANLLVVGGSSVNPIALPGLASFTADMLDEGTKNRSALKIANDLDQIGSSLFSGSGQDAASVGIKTLTKTVDPAFDILSDVLLHPAFDQKEIDRVRNERLTSLQQDNDRPTILARKALYRVLYGPNNPYAYDERGTAQSTKSISREDMLKFWSADYEPGNGALVLVGDLTLDKAHALADKFFSGWKGTGLIGTSNGTSTEKKRAAYMINKEGAPQSIVSVGTMGMARSSSDYVAGRVLNAAFGGMFSSRLNMNLREKHGYTYGARAGFACLREPGPFVASASVRTDVTGPSIAEVFYEIDGMSTRPVSTQELQLAKDSIALSLPGRFETSREVAGTIGELFVYSLPLDYYRKLPAQIDATTSADVESIAKKYLKPEEMIVITVGDKSKIEPALKKLNLGPIQELDFEGNPINK